MSSNIIMGAAFMYIGVAIVPYKRKIANYVFSAIGLLCMLIALYYSLKVWDGWAIWGCIFSTWGIIGVSYKFHTREEEGFFD